MCTMAIRMIQRHALRLLFAFVFTTMILMFFLGTAQNETELQEVTLRTKAKVLEELRLRKLADLQKTIFLHPIRPPDHTYNINVTRSEHTPLQRDVPDSRPESCKEITYDIDKLPTISVIIPFYNEALSMLLRTTHSILLRTPPKLLSDIILVNDNSPNADLGAPLEKYVKLLPEKVKLLRTQKREGLIRARLIGAKTAKGTVIMFQDAHTEVNHGWAEPLLDQIQRNPKAIVQPFVEQIDAMTIQYNSVKGYTVPRGGFSWDLRYTWMEMPEHERKRLKKESDPFRTPTLVGCALAANKEYFFSIGAFDDDFNIWGGENIELAFRNWMCGGQVLTHPCARVAHTFKPFSYEFDGDREKIVQKNLMRLAELWMGDHKKFFLAATYNWEFKRTFFTEKDLMSLEKRKQLKRKLECRNFEWYLKNIVPEIPTPPLDATYYGEVANEKSEACWFITDDGYVGLTYFCFFHRTLPQNLFYIDTEGRLKFKDRCVRVETSTWLMKLGECLEDPKSEYWDVKKDQEVTGLTRLHISINGETKEMCVMQVTNINPVHKKEQMPQLTECVWENPFQHWRWTYKFDFNYNFDKPLL